GIGTTADATNRLSVNSPAVLFNRETDDVQLKLNKEAAGDTASLLFQTGFSGRAEVGLAGSDALSFKVSEDGAAWTGALRLDAPTGMVSARAFDSVQVVVGFESVVAVETPSAGGMVFISVVSPAFPINTASGVFVYDTGASPALVTLVALSNLENMGTTPLTGTSASPGSVGVAVDSSGSIHIENQIGGGAPRQICLTF